ncbi:MAG TPA: SIMPL domain-containing protein [Thermoanaerobaculia bacterium]|nr:SIMPL domain-containing protein [Thermoanaerobaculia bacterium]
MRRLFWILAMACVAPALLAQSGLLASDSSPRSISVTGEALQYVVPDQAVVRLGIEAFDASLEEAVRASDARAARLVRAVRQLGVEERGIQADHAEVEIVYPKDGVAAGIAGYRVRKAYAITLKDLARLDAVVAAALKAGVNHLEGYELQTTELRRHRDEARRGAISAAREKAEALAREVNCSIGPPRTIGEGYYGWFGTRGYSHGWGSMGFGQNAMTQNVTTASESAEPNATTPLGQIGVRAQVSVTFDLLPKGPAPKG